MGSCLVCSTAIESVPGSRERLTCSHACRQKLYRQREAAKRAALSSQLRETRADLDRIAGRLLAAR